MYKEVKIVKAFAWKLFERFGVQIVQFVLQIILARILSPEHYGTLSLLMIFTSLANIFIQRGFSTALIQSRDVKEEDYSSIFWVSLSIASIIYILLYISAPPLALFYEMPEIVAPLRILALMIFPGALNSVQLARVSREMNFRKLCYSNIFAVIGSGIVGIFIAYMGGGLWALVMQSLLNVIFSCCILFVVVRFKIYFVCDLKRVKVLFGFGWKLLVSGLIDTLYADLRSLVVGKKYDTGMLGYYNRGKQFPQFIINAINGAVQSVMLPAMSAEQDDKKRVKAMMRYSIMLSAYIIFPVMAGLAAVAEPLVSLLLTDKWLRCVPFLQIYCFSFAFYPVHSCNLQAINAMGRSDIFLKLEIVKKAYGILVLAIVVFCFDSPIAIAGTGLVTTWIGWFVNAYPNKKLIGYSYIEQIIDLVPSIVLAGGMCVIVLMVGKLGLSASSTLAFQIITGVAVYFILSFIVKPTPYKVLMAQAKQLIQKRLDK